MTPAMTIASTGLAAATLRLNVSAQNVANVGDVAPIGGAPAYVPQGVSQSPVPSGGVTAKAVTLAPSQMLAYEPTSPFANGAGLVQAPEIDPLTEVSNQLQSSQAFAYSLAALKAANEEQQSLLDMTT